jgi:hypothetical protein
MADNRTISQLEAEGYPWIGCECCKGTVWVPFKMIRQNIPMLSAMTLDELGAKMRYWGRRCVALAYRPGCSGWPCGHRYDNFIRRACHHR